MKFDIFNWHEVTNDKEIKAGPGLVRLRCSSQVALYASAHGFTAIVGSATEFEFEISEAVTLSFEALSGVSRVFIHRAPVRSFRPEGEIFTNIDRQPHESGAVAEVTRAMRMIKLDMAAERRAMAAQRAELDQSIAAAVAAAASGSPPAEPPVVPASPPVTPPGTEVLPG